MRKRSVFTFFLHSLLTSQYKILLLYVFHRQNFEYTVVKNISFFFLCRQTVLKYRWYRAVKNECIFDCIAIFDKNIGPKFVRRCVISDTKNIIIYNFLGCVKGAFRRHLKCVWHWHVDEKNFFDVISTLCDMSAIYMGCNAEKVSLMQQRLKIETSRKQILDCIGKWNLILRVNILFQCQIYPAERLK